MRYPGLILALAGTVLTYPATSAADELSYDQYKDLTYHDSTPVKHFIEGVLAGFGVANSYLKSHNQPTLYCQSELVPLPAEAAQQMMDAYIDKNCKAVVIKGYFTIETTLLSALTNAFPCPSAATQ